MLGVPEIPDPLGSIPKIVPDVIAIFTFITNLPISLVKLAKAIIKKKIKMLAIIYWRRNRGRALGRRWLRRWWKQS